MESHNDKSQAPLKLANYDEKSKPVKPEKRIDPGVPIAKKTITHRAHGNLHSDAVSMESVEYSMKFDEIGEIFEKVI